MNIHMNRPNANGDENGNAVGEIPLEKMKGYIAYCKRYNMFFQLPIVTNSSQSKCAPRLSAEAQEMLSSHFVGLRKQVQQVERDNDERSSIPITIRSVNCPIVRFLLLLICPTNQSAGSYHPDI